MFKKINEVDEVKHYNMIYIEFVMSSVNNMSKMISTV